MSMNIILVIVAKTHPMLAINAYKLQICINFYYVLSYSISVSHSLKTTQMVIRNQQKYVWTCMENRNMYGKNWFPIPIFSNRLISYSTSRWVGKWSSYYLHDPTSDCNSFNVGNILLRL